MDTQVRRVPNDRWSPGGRGVGVFGTILLHAAMSVVFLAGTGARDVEPPPVYAVRLVAAPRSPTDRPRPEAVERPAQQEPAVQTTPSPPQSEPDVTVKPPEPDIEREPTPQTNPEDDVEPESPSTGSDQGTLEIPGVDFPYPGYLRNIVAQVYRRWSRPGGNVSLRAEVLFFVRRDGSMASFQFVQRSGNLAFDLRAQGAVEAAGNSGAFGPLPDGYADDVLPVSFFFDPRTLR